MQALPMYGYFDHYNIFEIFGDLIQVISWYMYTYG